MTRRQLLPDIVWLLPLLLAGCHFFDDPDQIQDEMDDCPLNSGYPCACDPDHKGWGGFEGVCNDGSDCLYIDEHESWGFCSMPCVGVDDTLSCLPKDGSLGIGEGFCGLQLGVDYDHCVLVCEYSYEGVEVDGPCPPGMRCEQFTEQIKVCVIPDLF